MLAQFSIWPLDEPHMSGDMAHVTDILDRIGCDYQLGPMGTTVQGSWSDVMNAIQTCHEALRDSHQRLLTTITIDDDATREQTLHESTAKVSAQRQG